jgi:hypothetical protein
MDVLPFFSVCSLIILLCSLLTNTRCQGSKAGGGYLLPNSFLIYLSFPCFVLNLPISYIFHLCIFILFFIFILFYLI